MSYRSYDQNTGRDSEAKAPVVETAEARIRRCMDEDARRLAVAERKAQAALRKKAGDHPANVPSAQGAVVLTKLADILSAVDGSDLSETHPDLYAAAEELSSQAIDAIAAYDDWQESESA